MDTEPSTALDPSGYDPDEVMAARDTFAHASVTASVRTLVTTRRLAAPSPRSTVVRIAAAWGAWAAAASIGRAVGSLGVWIFAWLVIGWVVVGNAAMSHEAVHNHLFRSRRLNRAVGTIATATIFGSFATYRAYHVEHHARTAREGDPEGTPLNFGARWQYLAAMLLGGLYVLLENTAYTLIAVVGHPPRWVRHPAQLRAIRLNALLLAGVVGLAVTGLLLAPTFTLEVWIVPVATGIFLWLPLLLVPEHYGATGTADVLASTRSVRSNAVLRWLYWNNNYHAAHHLAPSVPYHRIAEVDDLLDGGAVEPTWRVRSYAAFHWGTLVRLAFNHPSPEADLS